MFNGLFEFWQIGLLAAGVLAAVLGGGGMLLVGRRWLAGSKGGYWHSVAVHVVGRLACVAITVLSWLIYRQVAPPQPMLYAAWVADVVCCLLLTWWIIGAMCKLSFGKAILAWLPTLVSSAVVTGMFVGATVPAFNRLKARVVQEKCRLHMRHICEGLVLFSRDGRMGELTDSPWPATLTELEMYVPAPCYTLFCPKPEDGRPREYFYHQPEGEIFSNMDMPIRRLVVCCRHDDVGGEPYVALFLDGDAELMSAEQFEDALAKPENAAFAHAYRQTHQADDR